MVRWSDARRGAPTSAGSPARNRGHYTITVSGQTGPDRRDARRACLPSGRCSRMSGGKEPTHRRIERRDRVPRVSGRRAAGGPRLVLRPALLALALAVAEAADTGADVTLVAPGGPVALTRPEQIRIAKRVEVLMVGCAITSVTEPDLFASRSLPGEWQAARAGSHLYVRFPPQLHRPRALPAPRFGGRSRQVQRPPGARPDARDRAPASPPAGPGGELQGLRHDRRAAGDRVVRGDRPRHPRRRARPVGDRPAREGSPGS